MRASLFVTILVAASACGGDDGPNRFRDAGDTDDASSDSAGTDTTPDSPVALTMGTTFAGGIGTLCGIAYDQTDNTVWGYACSGATINHYSAAGAVLGTIARPGESADDADLDVAPAAFTVGTTTVAAGDLLFINGETATADLYLPAAGATVTLATAYGSSHVVGGAFHVARNSIFLVQDRNAGTTANEIAEIDRVTGALLGSFSTLPAFDVNYGDMEVCQSSGNLFVVSSVETTLAEISPTGTLIAEYPLPAGVTAASGIGLEDATGAAWISSTSGDVVRMLGLPCGPS